MLAARTTAVATGAVPVLELITVGAGHGGAAERSGATLGHGIEGLALMGRELVGVRSARAAPGDHVR